MSLIGLSRIFKQQQGLQKEIESLYDFFSNQSIGDFETTDRIDKFVEIKKSARDWILAKFIEEGLLKADQVELCPTCKEMMQSSEESEVVCEDCQNRFTREKIVIQSGFRILRIFQKRNSLNIVYSGLEKLTPFQSSILHGVVRFIFLMNRKNPYWLKEIKSNVISCREDYYRDALELSFTTGFDVGAEVNHTDGRSDLIIKNTANIYETIVAEFKIWASNDYKNSCGQVMGYLDNFQDTAFIFMINDNKNSVWDKYVKEVVVEAPSFISDSIVLNPLVVEPKDFRHLLSKHKLNDREIRIYHFVFDNY